MSSLSLESEKSSFGDCQCLGNISLSLGVDSTWENPMTGNDADATNRTESSIEVVQELRN